MRSFKISVVVFLFAFVVMLVGLWGCAGGGGGGGEVIVVPAVSQVGIALGIDARSLAVPNISVFFWETINAGDLIADNLDVDVVNSNFFDSVPFVIPPGRHIIGFNAAEANGTLIFADALGLKAALANTRIEFLKQAPDGFFDVIFVVNMAQVGRLEVPAEGITGDVFFIINVDIFGNIFQEALQFNRLVID